MKPKGRKHMLLQEAMAPPEKKRHLNLTLSAGVVELLHSVVPYGYRSRYVEMAIERALREETAQAV